MPRKQIGFIRLWISLTDDYRKGLLVTIAGVLVICPDTLLLRMIDADQWTVLFWRGLLSGLVILTSLFVISPSNFLQRVKSIGGTGIVFCMMFSLGTILFIVSISHTSVANSLFIVSTSPFFAALIARYFLHESVSRETWLLIFLALGGVALMASSSLDKGDSSWLGDLAAAGVAVTMAITFSLARSRKSVSMVPAMGFSGLMVAAAALLLGTPHSIGTNSLLPLLLMAVVVVPLAFSLLTIGPRYIPAPQVSLLLLAEAVIGPLLVWMVIGEHPGNRSLFGGVIVLLALAYPNIKQLTATKPAS